MGWRLTVRREHSEEIHDLPDVQALRSAIMRLRADPSAVRYEYIRQPEQPERNECPRCGQAYYPGNATADACRCGITHTSYECRSCWLELAEPPKAEGCAPLPFDAERWSARDWDQRRKAR